MIAFDALKEIIAARVNAPSDEDGPAPYCPSLEVIAALLANADFDDIDDLRNLAASADPECAKFILSLIPLLQAMKATAKSSPLPRNGRWYWEYPAGPKPPPGFARRRAWVFR